MFKFDPLKTLDPSRPLVSVILRVYEGDRHLLPRACASIARQDLDPSLIEVLIVHDGPPNPPDFDPSEFGGLVLAPRVMHTARHWGYYCVPSNMGLVYATGLYVAHLDADNEWEPDHLSTLLTAIRLPYGDDGFPHFTYSRINYVLDPGAKEGLPQGYSPMVWWKPETVKSLMSGPYKNFIDSSAFLIDRSRMFLLANQTGAMWNPEVRRFGDWELIYRLAATNSWGLGVDNPSLIYHWTGKNLQLIRPPDETSVVPVPQQMHDELAAQGRIRDYTNPAPPEAVPQP